MTEKRHFTRITSHFTVSIESKKCDDIATGKLVDISLKGLLIEVDSEILTIGEKYVINLPFPGSEITMLFEAECVHADNGDFGFKFIGEDVDTMTHLRRFLELNLGDPGRITQELEFLIK